MACFELYRPGTLGELHQTFLRDVSWFPQGHKDFSIRFWGISKFFNYAILRLYCKYFQTGKSNIWMSNKYNSLFHFHSDTDDRKTAAFNGSIIGNPRGSGWPEPIYGNLIKRANNWRVVSKYVTVNINATVYRLLFVTQSVASSVSLFAYDTPLIHPFNYASRYRFWPAATGT